MAKNHCKSVAAPKSWPIPRKKLTFVTKPNPGPHRLDDCISLKRAIIDLLGLAKTNKEVSFILNNKEVILDGKRTKEAKNMVGLFDTLSFPAINKKYRMVYGNTGQLQLIEVDDDTLKPVKILNKTLIKKKIQLNLSGGRCMLIDKNNYKVGDTLIVDVPSQKIKQHIVFGKGARAYLTAGKYKGKAGQIDSVIDNLVSVKLSSNELIMTAKRHVFVVGDIKVEP